LSADEIVVSGERPRQFRIVTKKDRKTGMTRCGIKPSSGDILFDEGVCRSYLACAQQVDTSSAMEACLRPLLVELVKGWRARRIDRVRQRR
jgi:hypothetical protein